MKKARPLDDPRVPFDKLLTPNNIRSRLDKLERQSGLASDEVGALDEITERTGNLVVDNIVAIPDEVEVTEPTDSGFTGSGMSGTGKTFANIADMVFNVFSVAAGAIQAGFNTLGQFIAGAGNVKIDADGHSIVEGTATSVPGTYKPNGIKFLNSDGSGGTVGEIYQYFSSSSGYRVIQIRTVVPVDATKRGAIELGPVDSGGNYLASFYIDGVAGGVGINGPAEAGYAAKVTGSLKTTGPITVDASTVALGTQVGTGTIADDGVFSFTPPLATGILIAMRSGASGANAEEFITAFYDTANSRLFYTAIGTETNQATGALTGTTGTDGKFTVSVHTDGKIYFENRRGAARAWRVAVLTL